MRELRGHEVVICTRHRPDDLASALRAISASTSRLDVLVVDSSEDERSRLIVDEAARTDLAGWRVRYLHADAGLPHQRNVGLDASASEIVHFIDDDADVFPDYFATVADAYDAGVVGVGGVQHHIAPRRPSRWRLLGQIEARPGRLSKSAVNNLVTESETGPVEVDWLSGCCMSFRTDVARQVRFDEQMSGYALGEDVEFSLRVGRRGRLMVDPSARVNHKLSPTNRNDVEKHVRDTLRWRRRMVEEHPEKFSVPAFWYSVGVDALRYTAASLAGRSDSRLALSGLIDAVRRSNEGE